MGAVFISYRRGDSEGQARALSIELEELIGKDSVFMDVDSIALGRDFRQVLQERLQACDIMLALIGPNWLDAKDAGGNRRLESPSDFVRQEIGSALKRNIPVTPVLLQGANMPAPDRLPPDLQDLAFRNGFELSHTRWESDVRELVKRLGLTSPSAVTPNSQEFSRTNAVSSASPADSKYARPAAGTHPPASTRPSAGNDSISQSATDSPPRSGRSSVLMIGAGVVIVVIIAVLAWTRLSGNKSSPSPQQVATTDVATEAKRDSAPQNQTAAPVSFDPIVAGVSQIVLGEKGVAGPVAATAEGWVTIASGDKTVASPKAFVMARQFEVGRVAAFGHPGFLSLADTHPDNPLFIANLVRWLAAGKGQRACFTVAHGEPEVGVVGAKTAINIAGFEVSTIPATINSYTISNCSVLVINNRTSAFTSDEVQTVKDYVVKGNGVLLGGLGWAYANYSATKNIQDYPMLQLGRIFGVEWPTSYILDPDSKDQAQGSTVFRTLYPNATP